MYVAQRPWRPGRRAVGRAVERAAGGGIAPSLLAFGGAQQQRTAASTRTGRRDPSHRRHLTRLRPDKPKITAVRWQALSRI